MLSHKIQYSGLWLQVIVALSCFYQGLFPCTALVFYPTKIRFWLNCNLVSRVYEEFILLHVCSHLVCFMFKSRKNYELPKYNLLFYHLSSDEIKRSIKSVHVCIYFCIISTEIFIFCFAQSEIVPLFKKEVLQTNFF